MKESEIQSDIMDMLLIHPRVAWAMVVTTGKFRVKGGFVTTGHYMSGTQKQKTGMSDIIGMLKSGQLFSIEVKKPNESPTEEQYSFIGLVNDNHGISGWATNPEEAREILKAEK